MNLTPVCYIRPAIYDQDWEKCGYFIKTGVCKYANLCSKSHIISSNEIFTTLIFPAMYSTMLLGYELLKNDQNNGINLKFFFTFFLNCLR